MAEICVTGLGVVSALGVEENEHVWGLENGVSAITKVSEEPEAFPAFSGHIKNLDMKKYIPRKLLRNFSNHTAIAFIAGRKAVESREKSDNEALSDDERGIILGADVVQTLSSVTPAVLDSLDEEMNIDYEHFGHSGYRKLPPLWMLFRLPNTAGGQIAIDHSLKGVNYSVVNGETSGFVAVGQAFTELADGRGKLIFTGGTEQAPFADFLHRLKRYHPVSMTEEGGKPFGMNSDGLVTGTGAALMILERKEEIRPEDREKYYGKVLSYSNLYNPKFRTATVEEIAAVYQRSMEKAMKQSNLKAGQIGFIQASGIGIPKLDEAESLAIKNIFGSDVPVTCCTGNIGYSFASSGALRIAYALLQLKYGFIAPIARCENPFYEEAVNYVRGKALTPEHPVCLCNSFDTFGAACSMILQR